MTLIVRTASDPLAFSVPVQKKIAELDRELPVFDVLTMQQIIERSLGNASLSASLVLAFAVLSLILASVGLYGVLSYLTTQRTGEIGIRIALGAQREQVLRLMLADGLRPALFGLVLGLAASVVAVRLIDDALRNPASRSGGLRRCGRNVACGSSSGLPGACMARLAPRSDAGITNGVRQMGVGCTPLTTNGAIAVCVRLLCSAPGHGPRLAAPNREWSVGAPCFSRGERRFSVAERVALRSIGL